MSELLTTEELADRLKVKPATVRLWRRQGIIPAIQITGTVYRFDPAEVEAELRRQSDERQAAKGARR